MSHNNTWSFLPGQDVCLHFLRAFEIRNWKRADKCYEFKNSFKVLSCGRILFKARIKLVSGYVFPLVFTRQKWVIIEFAACCTQFRGIDWKIHCLFLRRSWNSPNYHLEQCCPYVGSVGGRLHWDWLWEILNLKGLQRYRRIINWSISIY